MTAYLVDGTLELFRCFHGAPRAKQDGREVGAVRGLAHTLISLLRTPDLTHVAVAFDPMGGTVRLPGDRSPNAVIREQYPLAAATVRALGIALWPMVRYAADDGLASGARQLMSTGRVVICSTDLDLMQCVVADRVVLLDRIRKRTTDEAGVMERFGVSPTLVPDWLALVGDRSDGLPGVPGCGPKSAAALLTSFGSVDAIPLDHTAWPSFRSRKRVHEAFVERHREIALHARLSRKHTDLAMVVDPDVLRWRGADQATFEALAATLGAPDLLDRTLRFAD